MLHQPGTTAPLTTRQELAELRKFVEAMDVILEHALELDEETTLILYKLAAVSISRVDRLLQAPRFGGARHGTAGGAARSLPPSTSSLAA